MPDEKGETRRERNERFEVGSPLCIVPTVGRFIWNWYFSISDSLRRVRDGVCEPISPTQLQAWLNTCGDDVHAREIAVLRAMDVAFCAEMQQELADYHARERDRMEAEAAKARKGGQRR